MIKPLKNFSPEPHLLKDKIILITGAGDGIGKAVAKKAASLGAQVILLGRTEKKLDAVYDEIELIEKNRATIIPFDLMETNAEPYQQVASFTQQTFGQLDGLVHCASELGAIQPLHQTKPGDFLNIIQTNLNSHFLLTQACIDLLGASQQASVIFTSSSVGRKARAFWGAYSISKIGIEAMSKIFYDELSEAYAIRFNTLNPGATNTAMRRSAYPTEKPESNPCADDIANAYMYLLSEESGSINGQQLDAQKKK